VGSVGPLKQEAPSHTGDAERGRTGPAARDGQASRPHERTSETIVIDDHRDARVLVGERDRHLRLVRDAFDVRVFMRGGTLTLEGERKAVSRASAIVAELLGRLRRRGSLQTGDVEDAIREAQCADATSEDPAVRILIQDRTIRPRTRGQAGYIRAMQRNDLVFCVGPAGTGKTYLAVAMAVASLWSGQVGKIVLARPAVEAGERLGFLPGDLQAKVNPYLRPLYDALHDMMGYDSLRKFMERDLVEVAPLAYMRGRNLDKSFIILDEAQNCTRTQMKMFLTRLGAESRSVVTGDVSQVDLPADEVSGMVEAMAILRGIVGLVIVRLTQRDIVRHRLVQEIVDAYDVHETGSSSSGQSS